MESKMPEALNQVKSPEVQEQPMDKSDFDFIRLKLLEASEKVHWIQLEPEVQERICLCLGQMSIESLAAEILFELQRLEVFLRQKSLLELLLKEIAEDRDRHQGSRYVTYSNQTREKVYGYFDFISVNRLTSIIGIPRSTLDEWKKRSEKKEIGAAAGDFTASDISKSELTQRLKILFKRHDGKPTRRYSASEKELILKLIDAYGSKSVHEEMKVSFDTIARLKRERARGFPQIAVAIKYAPVIETMKKYPRHGANANSGLCTSASGTIDGC